MRRTVKQTIRDTVLIRAGLLCERCGGSLMGVHGMSVHHRLPRGMGGSRNPTINGPENLLALCGSGTTGCHGWVESHRQEAYETGLLVKRGDDPALVPVHVYSQGPVLLAPDGTYATRVPNPG